MAGFQVPGSRSRIRFLLDGEVIETAIDDPTRTVLRFLREDLGRTGTKEGCAEGDCGACTVAVATVDERGERLAVRAVNACIQFLPTLDGCELLTVESLAADGLHPAQQAMVDNHGSQCGFCTPGIVMSLFALFKNNPDPSRRDIDNALAGNLCRCTGYSPIIIAAREMYAANVANAGWLQLPAGTPVTKAERERIARIAALHDERPLYSESAAGTFFAPRSADQLAAFLEHEPDATILAGGTDVGLWVTKAHRALPAIAWTGKIDELRRAEVVDGSLEIGAAVSLSDAMPLLVRHFPAAEELFLRFASPPIRNAGTLGGNVANGSPIGDAMPLLLVLDTELVLRSKDATRVLPLAAFYRGYQQTALMPGEFLEKIRIPLSAENDLIAAYKVSKRFDQDISAVCGAYRLRLDGDRVGELRVAYGGMAEIPRRANACESALQGARWEAAALEPALAALDEDFSPISDMRASAGYRRRVCGNLLKRFFQETTGGAEAGIYAYGR